MPQIARKGDISDHGLAFIDAPAIDETVFVNSLPIAINNGFGKGASFNCGLWQNNAEPGFSDDTHPLGRPPLLGGPGIPGPVEGSPTVFAGGLPVHRFRDGRGCGAETTTASPNVWADSVEQIRIPGATVQDPIPSPAAPKSITIRFGDGTTGDEVWAFSEGLPYGVNFYKKRSTAQGKPINQLQFSDFKSIGPIITFDVEFEEQLGDFDVPDIDQATRDSIPRSAGNQDTNTIALGILAPDFPSFGVDTYTGKIKMQSNTVLLDTVQDFYTINTETCIFTPTGFPGYNFVVKNESGSVTATIKMIIMPKPPADYCGDILP